MKGGRREGQDAVNLSVSMLHILFERRKNIETYLAEELALLLLLAEAEAEAEAELELDLEAEELLEVVVAVAVAPDTLG